MVPRGTRTGVASRGRFSERDLAQPHFGESRFPRTRLPGSLEARSRRGDTEYDNPQGNRVEVRFRGISSLNVIHDELENGAELLFTSEIAVSEERLAQILQPKDSLNVFRPVRRLDGPDVSAGYIVEEAMRMITGPDTDE